MAIPDGRALPHRLHRLLTEVTRRAGCDFSGLGVIVTDTPERLPVVPLRSMVGWWTSGSTVSDLVRASEVSSEFHDGFHVLSSSLELLLLSRYFSPPIVPGLLPNPDRRGGGRYMAAMFGSTLSAVLATGTSSGTYGIAVFQNGREADGDA